MNAELARHWIEIIRAQLPDDVNVESLMNVGQAGIIFIDRPAPLEGRQNRRSRNIRLRFPEATITQYLNETQPAQAVADTHLVDFILRRIGGIDWEHDEPRHEMIPGEVFVMDNDVIFP